MASASKTAIIAMAFLIGGCHQLMAQGDADSVSLRPSFGLDYTSELQTDFSRAKWNNLLQLRADVPLSRKFSFHLASSSFVTTREDYLANDLQGFSNIDSWNIPFTLMVAGFTWHINDRHSLFAGIRRIDEDYFCSDALSLFTNSSCGGFPTITANCPVATYPVSALGIHYAYDRENLAIQASLYNGTGAYEFTGRYNVFRISPQNDGLFALGQVEYRHHDSHYFLGASLYDGDLWWEDKHDMCPSVWAYAEQKLTPGLTLLAAYGHAFDSDEFCKNFCGLGATYTYKKLDFGLFSDYTRIIGIDEWATELTCNVNLTNYLSVQPALHIIKTDDETNCIGVLRLNVSL